MRMAGETGVVTVVSLCVVALLNGPALGQGVAPGERPPQRSASIRSLQVTDGDGLAFGSLSPDGRLMTTIGLDRKIGIWDMGTGELLRSDRHRGGAAICGALSADGKLLATGTYGDRVHFWDVAAGKRVGTLTTGERKSLSVDFSPDRERVAVASEGGTVAVWNLKPQQNVWTSAKQSRPVALVVFSPDGTTLATTTYDRKNPEEPGEVKLWDAQNGNELAVLWANASGHIHARFSPDGKLLAAAGADRELRIWDVESRELSRTISTPRATSCLAFLPDGKRILTGHYKAPLSLWDIDSGRLVAEYTDIPEGSSMPGPAVRQVSCSRDGSLIAAAGAKGEVVFWTTQPDESTAGETSAKRVLGWSADKPSGHVVLSRMIKSMREADTVYYEGEYRSELQDVAGSLCEVAYKLWAKNPNSARIEAVTPEQKEGVLITDGEQLWIHWPTGRPPFNEGPGAPYRKNQYMQGPAASHGVSCIRMYRQGVWLHSMVLDPSLFHGGIISGRLDTVRSVDTETVGEEECDVIETSHTTGTAQWVRRLWVSRKDHLPRKLELTSRTPYHTSITHEVWSNVRINEPMPADQFHWRAPRGWTRWDPAGGGGGPRGKRAPTQRSG